MSAHKNAAKNDCGNLRETLSAAEAWNQVVPQDTLAWCVRGDTSVAQRTALRGSAAAEMTDIAGKEDDDFE
jgi:hypothetical protein